MPEMKRKPVIAANWKMCKTPAEAVDCACELVRLLRVQEQAEIVICPPFPALESVGRELKGTQVGLGAQDVHFEEEGAYTGEVSARMLSACGCRFVIAGHSERRQYFGETDATVNRKLKKILESSLVPIFCLGESLEEREAGRVQEVILGQLRRGLDGLTSEAISRIIVAYEPVWAIGTGRTATPETAQEVHALIREWLTDYGSEELSSQVRILYGGSVKPENISDLMRQADIDGALVGGASLNARSFAGIIQYE